jgi:phospholipid/cholesterol/gamma-HCH transport system ATP-binding protein
VDAPLNTIIQVEGLSASLGGQPVLSDVSFTARKGDITVIIGGSGSGKTTLMKHLLGLYPLTTGYIRVLGRDLKEMDEKDWHGLYLQTGVLYQHGALLNSLTVGENVRLPLEQHSRLPEEVIERVARLKLQLVGLSHAFHLYPAELSGGMLKRAALARAIVMDPPLLLCDEPGAGLDPQTLEALDRLLRNLCVMLGISIVLVTHEVASIRRLADRLIFLDGGRVRFEGRLPEALESPIPALQAFFHAGGVGQPPTGSG